MRETTDTTSQFNDDIPDGTYDFRIAKVYGKDIKGKRGYEWSLDYTMDGNLCNGRVLTWPNQIGPLLAILGATELSKGKYEWEPDLMEGKTFKATIIHEPNKKDPSKIYQNMKDFKPSEQTEETPF